MSKISFVYFDVGGVALKDLSDTPKWQEILDSIGLGQFDPEKVEAIYKAHDNEICTGKMHIDDILPIYQKEFGINFDPEYSLQKAVIDSFATNPLIWPLIKQCQSVYKIGLLTDMWTDMYRELEKRKLIPDFNWDVVIDSSIEGLRKPYPEIYQLAQQKAAVPPGEILFIDNREKNLVPARQLGWQTYLYDSSNYEKSSRELAEFLSQNL